MEKKIFKTTFSELAKQYGFSSAFNGWYKQSDECLIALELQSSNYSHLYYLNMYVYVQGYNGAEFNEISKDLINGRRKILFRREDKIYSPLFDLNQENKLPDGERVKQIDAFFQEWLVPFSEEALTKKGVLGLIESGRLGGSKMIVKKLSALIDED